MPSIHIQFPDAVLAMKHDEIRKALAASIRLAANRAREIIRTAIRGGDAPASKTGALAKEIRFRMKDMKASATDMMPYALPLESGSIGGGGVKGVKSTKATKGTGKNIRRGHTANNPGIATTIRRQMPKPYLSRALDEKNDEITRRLHEAIMNGIEFRNTK